MILFIERIGIDKCIGEDGARYRLYDDINLLESDSTYYLTEGPYNDIPIR